MPDPTDNVQTITVRPEKAQGGEGKPIAAGAKLTRDQVTELITQQMPGLSKAGVEGVVRNVIRESGGNSGNDTGDHGTSGGLFQHHNTRLTGLKDYAKAQGTDWKDPTTQVKFAATELKRDYPTLLTQLQHADDPAEAEDSFKRVFERPASIMWENKPRLATDNYRYSDYALGEHKGRKGTDMVYMSPADYLDLSPDLEGKPFDSPSGRSIRGSVDRGEDIESVPSLSMKVDGKTGQVTDQDGRHRALLAQEHGVDAIPVAIHKIGEGDPTEIQGLSGNVIPNDFQKADTAPKSLLSRIGNAILPSAEAAEPANGNFWDSAPVLQTAEGGKGATGPVRKDGGNWWDAAPVANGAAQPPPAPDAGAKYAGWDTANPQTSAAANAAVPMPEEPGVHRGKILPFASDDQGHMITTPGGWPKLYTPEFIRAPIRGAVEGGQEILGQRPVNDPAARSDITAAASLGAGSSPAAAVSSVVERGGPGGIRPMYEFVSRLVGKDIAKNEAALRIVKRMEEDAKGGGPSAQDMLDIMNATPDKPLTLADLGGENLLGLAGKVARKPGEGRQISMKALNDRDKGAGSRLAGDVDQSLAAGSAHDATAALAQARAKAADPVYKAAYAKHPINPDEMAENGRIGSLINRPSTRSGMRSALKIAGDEGVSPKTLGIDLDAEGVPFFTEVPTWKTLDYVKRGLDNVVEQYRDKATGKLVLDTEGRAADNLRTQFRQALRDLNPEYGKALDAYSGPSSSISAMKAGQDFLRQRPEEITRRIGSLSPGDKEFYKLGAADTLRTALAKKGVGGDETKAILRSDYMRNQLRPLFDNEAAYQRFITSVEAEGRMFGTRHSVLGNSATAARVAEDSSPELDILSHAARSAGAAAAGSPLHSITNALKAASAWRGMRDPAINADVARLLHQGLNDTNTHGRLNALTQFMTMLPQTRQMLSRYAPPSSRFMAPAGIIGGNALNRPPSDINNLPGNGQ